MPTKLTAAQKDVIRKMREGDDVYKDHYWGNVFFSKNKARLTKKMVANLELLGLIAEIRDILNPNCYYQLTTLGKTIEL